MIFRSYRYRLYPTTEQEVVLTEHANAVRYVYNIAVEQRRDWWRQFQANTGRRISYASQCRELTAIVQETDWLRSAPRSALNYALQDVDRAFATFFRKGGFPNFRSKERHIGFRTEGRWCPWRRLNGKWAVVFLPKIGEVKFRCTRDVLGKSQNVSIRKVAGAWFVSFVTANEATPSEARSDDAIGIDRGVANTIAMSNGEITSLPASVANAVAARNRAQRRMNRGERGSRRRAIQLANVAKHHAHVAAARKHWLNERSTSIANRFGTVALESLRIANLVHCGQGKHGLNRSILEQGWATFAAMLEYKVAARGGRVYYVNPAYTSQTCSSCGSVDARSRKSQADFDCVDCGHRAHADVNAAINILRRSPACAEVPGYGAVEARPGEMLTHLENLAA